MANATSRARRRSRRSRGVALAEAALVFPIVLFCMFGIIEAGLFFATSSTTNNAARDGVRYGASNFAVASFDARPDAADQIMSEVSESLGALTGYGTPIDMWVYKADVRTGDPVDVSCNTRCYRYTDWDGDSFATQNGSWGDTVGTVGDVDACVGGLSGNPNSIVGGVDGIGVQVRVSYHTVSGLIGDRTISHHTALRLEPLPFAQCSPGT